MTTAQALKILRTAKTEDELLAKAAELGVCGAFFNIGGAVDLDKKVAADAKSKRPKKKPLRMVSNKRQPRREKTARNKVAA